MTDLKFLCTVLTSKTRPTCLYLGYTGYGNLGDEALKKAIFSLLKDSLILSESRGLLVRLLERVGLVRFQALILGGGTLLLRSEQMLAKLADDSIRDKVVFGTGVANPAFWDAIPGRYGKPEEWLKVLGTLQYLGVRGPLSEQVLRGKGFAGRVNVIGDPALYFSRPIYDPKPKVKRLGVNIGTTRSRGRTDLLWGKSEPDFFLRFASFLKVMVADGWEIEFVPVCREDIKPIERTLKLAGCDGSIGIFRQYTSVKATLDRLESFDVFVGQKLHAVILSYCANTPAVMVEYRPKCRDFMRSIGMQDFTLRTDTFTAEDARSLVEQLYQDMETVRKRTNKACMELKEKIAQAASDVCHLLDK